jgi:hypothetical protein
MTHWGLDFVISLTALSAIHALTVTGLFWLYAVFGILGLLYLAKRLPETKGRSLEDIERSLRARVLIPSQSPANDRWSRAQRAATTDLVSR